MEYEKEHYQIYKRAHKINPEGANMLCIMCWAKVITYEELITALKKEAGE